MPREIRPELSKRNKYWISKHRHYELKYFCLQYDEWKQKYNELGAVGTSRIGFNGSSTSSPHSDKTSDAAIKRVEYAYKMNLLERIAQATNSVLGSYILKAATEGLSYNQLSTKMRIPCGRDMYYENYRKFFWLLSKEKQ